MRNLALFLSLAIFAFLSFSACNRNSDDKIVIEKGDLTVKVTTSDNAVINSVVYIVNTEGTTSLANLQSTSWSKSFKEVESFSISASGVITDGENGTMKIELIRDGKVLKSGEASGDVLVTSASL